MTEIKRGKDAEDAEAAHKLAMEAVRTSSGEKMQISESKTDHGALDGGEDIDGLMEMPLYVRLCDLSRSRVGYTEVKRLKA